MPLWMSLHRDGDMHAILRLSGPDHQYMRERLPNVYQVFGHTQQESEPVITEQYACLDCRMAFLLTSEGNLIEAETTNKR